MERAARLLLEVDDGETYCVYACIFILFAAHGCCNQKSIYGKNNIGVYGNIGVYDNIHTHVDTARDYKQSQEIEEMSNQSDYEGYVTIEITPALDSKLKYARMLAERLTVLGTNNAAWTHKALGLGGSIREHIDVIERKVMKRTNTSFGTEEFLDAQIEWAEDVLTRAAAVEWATSSRRNQNE